MEDTEKKKSNWSFYVTVLVYLLFNLRIGSDMSGSTLATIKQMGLTAPYVAGITLIVVSVVQYASGGEKVPWFQRLQLFFTIGIFAGLVYGIYDYTSGASLP